jgi:hypothetical protein
MTTVPAMVRLVRDPRTSDEGKCLRYCAQSPSFGPEGVWENLGVLMLCGSKIHWLAKDEHRLHLPDLDVDPKSRFYDAASYHDKALFVRIRIRQLAERIVRGELPISTAIVPEQFAVVRASDDPIFST